jgi:pimeloyl-ACP methyl ester carboxylesterase
MAHAQSGIDNIVLVHRAWADGSGSKGVYDVLTGEGYHVSVVQNPTISLAEDAAATRRAIAAHDGPVMLVGHSYGGAVITEAGTDERVAGLVYIAGWVPDRGESVAALLKNLPADARPYRFFRRRTAIFSSTGRSSRPPSPGMSMPRPPCSWRMRRCHGVTVPSREP